MDVRERAATRVETLYRSWVVSPDQDLHQLAHAVRSGDTIAVCGVRVGAQGGVWPDLPTGWSSRFALCDTCARYSFRAPEPV